MSLFLIVKLLWMAWFFSFPHEFQITEPCLWVILVSLKKSESPVHNIRSFSIYTPPLMTQEHIFISVSRSLSYLVRCFYKLCYSMSSYYSLLLIYMLKLFNIFSRDMLIISFSRIVSFGLRETYLLNTKYFTFINNDRCWIKTSFVKCWDEHLLIVRFLVKE